MSTRNTPPSIDPKNNIPSFLSAIDTRFKTCPNSKRRHVPRSVQQRLIQTVGSAFYALYLQEHVQQRLLHQRWIIVRTKTSIALQMTICYSSLRAFRTSQPLIHLPPRLTQTACLPATFATLRATTAIHRLFLFPFPSPPTPSKGERIQPAPPCPGNISALGSWHRTFRETASTGRWSKERERERDAAACQGSLGGTRRDYSATLALLYLCIWGNCAKLNGLQAEKSQSLGWRDIESFSIQRKREESGSMKGVRRVEGAASQYDKDVF